MVMKVIVSNEGMDRAWHSWCDTLPEDNGTILMFKKHLMDQYGIDPSGGYLSKIDKWEIEIVDKKLAALFLLRYS